MKKISLLEELKRMRQMAGINESLYDIKTYHDDASLSNWTVLTNYGRIIGGSSQGESKDQSIEMLSKFNAGPKENLVAVQGQMIWVNGRAIGLELKDGKRVPLDASGHIDLESIAKYVQYYNYGQG